MTTQYSVKWQISANPKTLYGIENITRKERNCACLYNSYEAQHLFLWILKTSGVIHFRKRRVDENIVGTESFGSLDEFFDKNFEVFVFYPRKIAKIAL